MDGPIESYRDLRVWQMGMDLAELVYRATKDWPKAELYGMTSQARRAAVSVPANVAEGYGRQSRADYVRFLKIARGSLKELETHLLLAKRLAMADPQITDEALQMSDGLGRMLGGLIRKLATN